jgi:hypothetical protein
LSAQSRDGIGRHGVGGMETQMGPAVGKGRDRLAHPEHQARLQSDHTSSMIAISALSPRRGTVRMMRV